METTCHRNIECPEFKGIKTGRRFPFYRCWRNIECPEFKGIKTLRGAWMNPKKDAILNALNSKGLRLANRVFADVGNRNIECPEFKGIKTHRCPQLVPFKAILNALNSKGLRLAAIVNPHGIAQY